MQLLNGQAEANRKTRTAKFYAQGMSRNVARWLGAECVVTTWPTLPAEDKTVFTVICLHKQIQLR